MKEDVILEYLNDKVPARWTNNKWYLSLFGDYYKDRFTDEVITQHERARRMFEKRKRKKVD